MAQLVLAVLRHSYRSASSYLREARLVRLYSPVGISYEQSSTVCNVFGIVLPRARHHGSLSRRGARAASQCSHRSLSAFENQTGVSRRHCTVQRIRSSGVDTRPLTEACMNASHASSCGQKRSMYVLSNMRANTPQPRYSLRWDKEHNKGDEGDAAAVGQSLFDVCAYL